MTHENRRVTSEILWRLSTNLKRLRAARGYTQRALAKACGFSVSYIRNVEHGKVNISLANLETLAWGLNCTAEDLLRRPSNYHTRVVALRTTNSSVRADPPVLPAKARAYARRAERSRRLSIRFLTRAGIIEKAGKLARQYR